MAKSVLPIVLVLLLATYESLYKGWYSFLLAPSAVIVMPLEFFVQFLALKMYRKSPSRYLLVLRLAQLICFVGFYVCVVGFGDTKDVLLFGFLASTMGSPLTQMSEFLVMVFGIGGAILTVALLVHMAVQGSSWKKKAIRQ